MEKRGSRWNRRKGEMRIKTGGYKKLIKKGRKGKKGNKAWKQRERKRVWNKLNITP